jgi:hypothetical protein
MLHVADEGILFLDDGLISQLNLGDKNEASRVRFDMIALNGQLREKERVVIDAIIINELLMIR